MASYAKIKVIFVLILTSFEVKNIFVVIIKKCFMLQANLTCYFSIIPGKAC